MSYWVCFCLWKWYHSPSTQVMTPEIYKNHSAYKLPRVTEVSYLCTTRALSAARLLARLD